MSDSSSPKKLTKPQEIATAPNRIASLADVARLAGVSSGTVSRALSKPEMISEATRLRVLQAADQLGYVVNGAARALAMRHSKTVGAIVPRFGSSSFPTMIQALESSLTEQGYTLLLSAPEHRNAHGSDILRKLLERGVDAVALLGADQPTQILSMLAMHRIPHVMMWAWGAGEKNHIGFDEYEAAELVIAHLAGLGHRRIGFIGGDTSRNRRAGARFQGITRAMAKHGVTLCEEAWIETEYGFSEGFDAMSTIIGRQTSATAVVCGNDYLAAGALSALDRAGVPVPGWISIISFNDNDFAPFLHPPLTTVHLPIREIGATAGSYLMARLQGQEESAVPTLPVHLMVRDSTGPAVPEELARAIRKKTASRRTAAPG